MTQEFIPFPASKVQQLEAREQSRKPYQSPHHPKHKMAASGMSMSPTANPPAAGSTRNMPRPSAAPIAATVPAEVPVHVPARNEAEAVSFDLPSKFVFYPFKDLYIKPFKGLHLSKLSRARDEESILHAVEAVSSVLSTSTGEQGLAFKLTPNDYYACLYWLRMNSFMKAPLTHTSTCVNQEHLDKVSSGEWAADTLQHSEIVNKASLRQKDLTEVPNPEAFALEYPGVFIRPTTMHDVLQVLEVTDAEQLYLAKLAAFISLSDHPNATLMDRSQIVADFSADDIQTVEAYERLISDSYGIIEEINVTCKHCKAQRVEKIELEAHSFFPSAA